MLKKTTSPTAKGLSLALTDVAPRIRESVRMRCFMLMIYQAKSLKTDRTFNVFIHQEFS